MPEGDVLASKLAHEMFHAHQQERGDGRMTELFRPDPD